MKSKFIFVSLILTIGLNAMAFERHCKITEGGLGIFAHEISLRGDDKLSEIEVQEVVRGLPQGPKKLYKLELINDYIKGQTYRFLIQPPSYYGIVDDDFGHGSVYVNLLFPNYAGSGMCIN